MSSGATASTVMLGRCVLPVSRCGARARRRGLPLLITVPAALALFAGPALAESDNVRTFDFTAPGCGGVGGVAANQFTVPAGVTSMSVVIRGEQGGTFGGMGAELEGRIAVTPGQVLYACVHEGGGAGGAGDFVDGQRRRLRAAEPEREPRRRLRHRRRRRWLRRRPGRQRRRRLDDLGDESADGPRRTRPAPASAQTATAAAPAA